jgi:hypothetical protein
MQTRSAANPKLLVFRSLVSLFANAALQARVALNASSWKRLLGTDVDVAAVMTWTMSLPKHSGSEKRNVATNTTSGTLNYFSAIEVATHIGGKTVD